MDLEGELSALTIESTNVTKNLSDVLRMEIFPNLAQRLNIQIESIDSVQFDHTLQLQVVEIFREILLNIERHSQARNSVASLRHVGGSQYQVLVTDDSPLQSQTIMNSELAINAEKSKTLARLLKPLNAHYSVGVNPSSKLLEHVVQFSTVTLESNPLNELRILRYRAGETLADGFLKLSFFYGLTILPGLYIKGIPLLQTCLLTISLLFTGGAIFGVRYRKMSAVLALSFALIILPSLQLQSASCETFPALAWLFNGLLSCVFILSAVSENALARWLPGIAFLIESLLTIVTFPDSCNKILAGSTPGIILVLLAGFIVGRIRNQNLAADAYLSRQAEIEETNVSATEGLISVARDNLLSELSTFSAQFDSQHKTQSQQERALNLMIQKIRLFLICSEFFEHEQARALYNWAIQRIDNGFETRISILGNGEFVIDPSTWAEALMVIDEISGEQNLVLVILNTETLSLQLDSPQEKAGELVQRLNSLRISIPVFQG
jgi:signal transduction histidine kinase